MYKVAPCSEGGWFQAATRTKSARKFCNCFHYLSFSFPGETGGENRQLLELCRLACFSLSGVPEAAIQQAVELSSWTQEIYNQINLSKYWTTRSNIWSNTFDLKNQRLWVWDHQLSAQNMSSWNIKYLSCVIFYPPPPPHYTIRSGVRILCGMLCSSSYHT